MVSHRRAHPVINHEHPPISFQDALRGHLSLPIFVHIPTAAIASSIVQKIKTCTPVPPYTPNPQQTIPDIHIILKPIPNVSTAILHDNQWHCPNRTVIWSSLIGYVRPAYSCSLTMSTLRILQWLHAPLYHWSMGSSSASAHPSSIFAKSATDSRTGTSDHSSGSSFIERVDVSSRSEPNTSISNCKPGDISSTVLFSVNLKCA